MKRNSTSKIRKASSFSTADSESVFGSFWRSKSKSFVAKAVAGVVISVFGFILWRNSLSAINDLRYSTIDEIKHTLIGEQPYLFHCDSGTNRPIPSIFTDAHSLLGSRIGFGILNCSTVLPSGKSVQERFKLKSEWKPMIFATAPWMKPRQLNPKYLKDAGTVRKFVDANMEAKATIVNSDKDLRKFCEFDKKLLEDDKSIADTCILLTKGAKFAKAQSDLVKNLVMKYPKIKFASIDAKKLRLSTENFAETAADTFSLRIHALRNGTHYLPMTTTPTWDYMDMFVGHAIGSSTYEFYTSGEAINLVKPPKTKKPKIEKSSGKDKKNRNKGETFDAGFDPEPNQKASSSATNNNGPDDYEWTADKIQKEKERRRREQMGRQEKQNLFEGDDNEGDIFVADSYVDENEDEEVIEL